MSIDFFLWQDFSFHSIIFDLEILNFLRTKVIGIQESPCFWFGLHLVKVGHEIYGSKIFMGVKIEFKKKKKNSHLHVAKQQQSHCKSGIGESGEGG
jgi:hypothetical protein